MKLHNFKEVKFNLMNTLFPWLRHAANYREFSLIRCVLIYKHDEGHYTYHYNQLRVYKNTLETDNNITSRENLKRISMNKPIKADSISVKANDLSLSNISLTFLLHVDK